MERFFKRKSSLGSSDSVGSSRTSSSRQSELDEVLANLQAGPGLRIHMIEYDTNIIDEVRRAYIYKKDLVNLEVILSHKLIYHELTLHSPMI